MPTRPPQGCTRPHARGPTTKRTPAALTGARALRRHYVGTGSDIKTRTGRTSDCWLARTRHNRSVPPPGPPPAAPIQPFRRREWPQPTTATRQWRTPGPPHHAVREVDTKAANAESIDSHRICSNAALSCKGGSQRSKFYRKICDKSWDSAGLTVYSGVIEQDLRYSSFYRDRLGENSL